MVNLKSSAIVIFVLNSHISFQSLKHLEEKNNQTNKNKTPVSSHHFDKDVSFSFFSRINMQGILMAAPAEFDVLFFVVFMSQILMLMAKYFLLHRHYLKTSFCSS